LKISKGEGCMDDRVYLTEIQRCTLNYSSHSIGLSIRDVLRGCCGLDKTV